MNSLFFTRLKISNNNSLIASAKLLDKSLLKINYSDYSVIESSSPHDYNKQNSKSNKGMVIEVIDAPKQKDNNENFIQNLEQIPKISSRPRKYKEKEYMKDMFMKTLKGINYKRPLGEFQDVSRYSKSKDTNTVFDARIEVPDKEARREVVKKVFSSTDESDESMSTDADIPLPKKKFNYSIEDNPIYNTQAPSKVKEKILLKQNETILKSTETSAKSTPSEDETCKYSFKLDSENYTLSKFKEIDTPRGKVQLNLSEDEFDIEKFANSFNDMPKPLDQCTEDISYLAPDLSPTFNFAAYADKSVLIQELVKLGVKLHKIEKDDDYMRAILSLDIEKDLKPYVQFLHDCGVPPDLLGDCITANPMIFKEDMDDLRTRIRYLRAHEFSREMIAKIITKNPTWLMWATKKIDERLGFFQSTFRLSGSDLRLLATKQPKVITHNIRKLYKNTYAVKEEMGFSDLEMKIILLTKPILWLRARTKIVNTFDYLHNVMQLPHIMILQQLPVLECRRIRLKNRHEFLVELKKNQYDPNKPNYISPNSVALGSDVEFCKDVAKTSIETYNMFLKTR